MNAENRSDAEKLLVVLWDSGDEKANETTLASIRREHARLVFAGSIREKQEGTMYFVSAAAVMEADWAYCVFLRSGDTLTEGSLEEIACEAEHSCADMLYTDECRMQDGKREYLWKPDYSPDLLRSENYIGPRVVLSRGLIIRSGFRLGADAPDYDGILRLTEKAEKVGHIRRALVNAGKHPAEAEEKEMQALQAHLSRTGLRGSVEPGRVKGTYRIRYEIEGAPLVSILIPNWEHPEDLKTCVNSIREKSTWPNWEIVIVENNSTQDATFRAYADLLQDERIHLVRYTGAFNYPAIMNFGARYCSGEYILQLNNDTEVISPGWIEEMLMLAQRRDVGAAGAMLYYPDDTVQHAGAVMIWLDREQIPAVPHAYMGWARGETGELNRMAVVQNYSCVTGACLMVRKSVWQELGGMDEAFAVAYNDVDFCLRLQDHGYVNVWTPYAELYHMESKSRRMDLSEQQKRINVQEVQRFSDLYGSRIREGDPYGNPNSDKSIELQGIRKKVSEPVLYVPGTELDFTRKMDTAVFYETDGFWEAENQHTWTVGHHAAMQFRLSRWDRDLELHFQAFPFHVSQRLGIRVNGQDLGDYLISADTAYTVILPRDALREVTVLELALPDAVSPAEMGQGTDTRCLGIGIRKMMLSEWNGSKSSEPAPAGRGENVERDELSLIRARIRNGDTAVHGGDRRNVTLGTADLRKNILRWYPFRDQTEILEIFGGYGALTELLLEKAAHVTVIEPDRKKAEMLRERFGENTHLTVLEEMSGLKDGQSFDYVIRIETELDRDEKALAADAEAWERLLKPDGRLLWAVGNRMRMEHFASGDAAALAGEDMENGDILHGWSPADRAVLEERCRRNGLSVLRWFYPFPDQCFTYEVFTDTSLGKRRPETDDFPSEKPELRLFDARKVREALWDEGLAGVFCPAYLMEIGRKESCPETEGVDYVRISANRAPDFSICPSIDYAGDKVRKRACGPEGTEHIRNIRENAWQKGILRSVPMTGDGEYAECALLKDASLLERMRGYCEDGDVHAFWACLLQLKSILYADEACVMEETDAFHRVFGPAECQKPMHWISRVSIDLVPNNIYPLDGQWTVIDNEWVFDFAVPAEFILWRACLYLFSQNQFGKMLEGHDLSEFIGIDGQVEKIFEDWEKHFQTGYVQVHPVPKAQTASVRVEDMNRNLAADVEEKRIQLRQAGTELTELSGTKAYRIGRFIARLKGKLKGGEDRDMLSEVGNRLTKI